MGMQPTDNRLATFSSNGNNQLHKKLMLHLRFQKEESYKGSSFFENFTPYIIGRKEKEVFNYDHIINLIGTGNYIYNSMYIDRYSMAGIISISSIDFY